MADICPVLLVTLLLYLYLLPSGLSQPDDERGPDDAEDSERFGGTFSVKDYTSWLRKRRIQLFNYAVEVNETVVIWSPILPVPKGLHWSSLNMENELPASSNQKLGLAYSHYFDKFLKTYNKSWPRVFTFDRQNRYLRIQQVNLGYADLYRVHVDENKKDNERKKMSSKDQDFDVAITLMTYTSHKCEFKGRPQSPKQGDTLIMSCSVVVNGLWNTSLVFRNTYDGSEIRGEVSKCNRQPSVGSRICSTVRVKAEVDILAYTCDLEFLPDRREDPKNPMFQNSKWTARFNKEVACYLPKIYLEAIPSDVSFLCNNMPCGDTVEVSDSVSCVAHGYPQPVFDLHITEDTSASTNHKEESEALKRMFEHVDEIEKHIDDGGIVKRSLKNNVHSLLNSMINASIQLVKLGRGEDQAIGEGEEVDTTLGTLYRRNFSEMIDIISKHVHAIDRKLDGSSAIAASENGVPLPEITMQDLKEALTELEREIRTVGDKVHEKLNSSLRDIESNKYKKLEIIIATLLNISETLKSMLTEVPVPEENSLTNDEESEEDHEQLIDKVSELTVQFMDAYNLNTDEEKVTELYDSIVQDYEFPGLECEGHVFMDSDELSDNDEASPLETARPVVTEDQPEDTQGMPETDSLRTTEDIPAGTAESPADSREAGSDTDSDSVEESGDAVIPDNTTETDSDGEGTTKVLDSNLNDTETDEPPLVTDLPQLTDEDVGVEETTTEWNSDAFDSHKATPEPEPEESEEDGEESDDEAKENDKNKEEVKVEENEEENGEEEGPTEETVTDAASEQDEDGEVTSGTSESVETELKSFEEYQVQAKDVGHIEVSCNVSNALGWGYNTMLLQVSSPTQKPESSTINPTQPDKAQTMSPVTADKEPVEPDEQPVEPDEDPIEPDEQPVEPDEDPIEPDEKPVEPDEDPPEPDEDPPEPDENQVEPSKEPDELDKKPVEPDKKPDEPDKNPVEFDREVTEENEFSEMPETFKPMEDTQGGSLTTDSHIADEDFKTKPKGAAEKQAKAGAAAGDFMPKPPDPDLLTMCEQGIYSIIGTYVNSSCKDFQDAIREAPFNSDEARTSLGCSLGEIEIFKLLYSFIISGCKVEGASVGDMSGPDYSEGERQIVKLLTSYFSSGCTGAVKVGDDVGDMSGPGYSYGKRAIIKLLQFYFNSPRCRGDVGQSKHAPSGDPNDVNPGEGPNGAAGPHVQSVVLELFLLVSGVCLTRIEL